MKTRALTLIVILIFALIVILGSCETGKKVKMTKEDEEFVGTWINPDYDETKTMVKIIIKTNGTWDEYEMSYDDRPFFKCVYTITDKWIDYDGNRFYKIII